jgi:two-component system, OmpR family, phosphate regulon sensor histidine kinase PhoR
LRLGVRGKLFLVSLVLILTAVAVGGLYLRAELRARLESRIETELFHQAAAAAELVRELPKAADIDAVDSIADRLGRAADARVTIIAADGKVLGDSRLSLKQVRRIENHAGRPEVITALAHGRGKSRRYSTTLGTNMLYVALPCELQGSRGVVRVARALVDVDRSVSDLYMLLIFAALLAMGAAIVMSALASHFYSRTLRRIVKGARRLAEERGGHIMPIPSSDEIGGLIGSINSMSAELEALLSSLAAERNRFEAVLEGMGEGVIALDESRKITHINHTAQTLLGLDEPPLGRILSEVLRQPAVHEMLTHLKPGKLESCEIELRPSEATYKQLLVRATVERDGAGVVLVLRDVTELRRLERVRQDFVANVSHELRTPASVIRANVETLLDGAVLEPERARGFLEALQRSSNRLTSLIDDLLDISQIDSDLNEAAIETVRVFEVVKAVVGAAGVSADAKQIEIKVTGDESAQALADEKALSRVLANLLDNAVKYVQDNGKIVVRVKATESRIRIEVADDGPGIEARHRERIFERFYRVDKGRSREMGGSGLGLSIAKNLSESMGGLIGCQANEPRGSLFWLDLPRSRV